MTCTLPRPCRHHEKELYRAGLSEDALEKELQRDDKSPKNSNRRTEFDNKEAFRIEGSVLMMQPSVDYNQPARKP